jgi:hypothetical protein
MFKSLSNLGCEAVGCLPTLRFTKNNRKSMQKYLLTVDIEKYNYGLNLILYCIHSPFREMEHRS